MFIFEWLLEVARALGQFYQDNLTAGGPARRMWNQLRVMYGRGEIDQQIFFRLRDSLQKGYFIEGELQTYHEQGLLRLQREGRFVEHHFDPQISLSLDNLYMKRAMLEEVRMEMRWALQTMETQHAWILEQAESIRLNAQTALPDEQSARAYLEIRQDLVERLQTLERRTREVHQNLRQLDTLQAELGVYESELMLVDSQEHFANVKLALHRQ